MGLSAACTNTKISLKYDKGNEFKTFLKCRLEQNSTQYYAICHQAILSTNYLCGRHALN